MFCRKCGCPHDADAIFCTKCGANLKEIENNKLVSENQQESKVEVNTEANTETNTETNNTEMNTTPELSVNTEKVEEVQEIKEEVQETKEEAQEVQEVKKDVEAEVKQEIEAVINAGINSDIKNETPVIESLNSTQTDKVDITKPENIATQTTQGVDTNTTTTQEPEKKNNSLKVLLIVLVSLVGILVVAIIAVVIMFFTKPNLGKAALETQQQFTKEVEAANANNQVATDIKTLNEGSFTMVFYMDEILEQNYLLYGDAKDMAITVDYDVETGTFDYYITGVVENEEMLIEIMTMTIPEYQETYTKALEESNAQLSADLAEIFKGAIKAKGVKLDDVNYDYEYNFDIDAYELATALTEYSRRQAEIQNKLFAEMEIKLAKLDATEVGKLYTALAGEPTNYYVDYMVDDYNSQIDYYNEYLTTYFEDYADQYEEEMETAIDEFADIQKGDYIDIKVKTTEGLITYIELYDDYDTIIIEAEDFTSYLQSTYKISAKGDWGDTVEPIKFKLDVTPEKWYLGLFVDGGELALEWDLVATENNISIGYEDSYTDEKFTGTITGDAENGITLDMNSFGKLVFKPNQSKK